MGFYDTKRWEHLRESILRRDGYKCRYFSRYGKMRQANTVHHVFPRDKFPEYEWERWNLISLSHEAHNMMHYRETQELTDKGKELLRRVARANNIKVPEEYER